MDQEILLCESGRENKGRASARVALGRLAAMGKRVVATAALGVLLPAAAAEAMTVVVDVEQDSLAPPERIMETYQDVMKHYPSLQQRLDEFNGTIWISGAEMGTSVAYPLNRKMKIGLDVFNRVGIEQRAAVIEHEFDHLKKSKEAILFRRNNTNGKGKDYHLKTIEFMETMCSEISAVGAEGGVYGSNPFKFRGPYSKEWLQEAEEFAKENKLPKPVADILMKKTAIIGYLAHQKEGHKFMYKAGDLDDGTLGDKELWQKFRDIYELDRVYGKKFVDTYVMPLTKIFAVALKSKDGLAPHDENSQDGVEFLRMRENPKKNLRTVGSYEAQARIGKHAFKLLLSDTLRAYQADQARTAAALGGKTGPR